MKQIPAKTSNRFAVLKLIYLHGPMTAQEANSRLVNLNLVEISGALHHGVGNGHLTRTGYTYFLTGEAKAELEKLDEVREAYIGEIVPSRTAPAFKPLSDKSKFWLAPRREPLREVSFKNGSSGYQPTGYLA